MSRRLTRTRRAIRLGGFFASGYKRCRGRERRPLYSRLRPATPKRPPRMRNLDELFAALNRSSFRRSFHLRGKDREYLVAKGMALVLSHAADFVARRLAPAVIPDDGKQTPYRGHPVFVAQHATACCCRGCLEKWHRIARGRELSGEETAYVLAVLERWLRKDWPESPSLPGHPG